MAGFAVPQTQIIKLCSDLSVGPTRNYQTWAFRIWMTCPPIKGQAAYSNWTLTETLFTHLQNNTVWGFYWVGFTGSEKHMQVAQVGKINNSPSLDYSFPDSPTIKTTNTPGF